MPTKEGLFVQYAINASSKAKPEKFYICETCEKDVDELVEWMNDELDEWMVLIMKLWVLT